MDTKGFSTLRPMAALVALPSTRFAASPIAPQPACNQAVAAPPRASRGRQQRRHARQRAQAATAAIAAAMSAQAAGVLGSLQQLPDTYRGVLLDQFGEWVHGYKVRGPKLPRAYPLANLFHLVPAVACPARWRVVLPCPPLPGVLHDGEKPYPGAIEAVSQLAERGMRLLIISNSSRREHTGHRGGGRVF